MLRPNLTILSMVQRSCKEALHAWNRVARSNYTCIVSPSHRCRSEFNRSSCHETSSLAPVRIALLPRFRNFYMCQGARQRDRRWNRRGTKRILLRMYVHTPCSRKCPSVMHRKRWPRRAPGSSRVAKISLIPPKKVEFRYSE